MLRIPLLHPLEESGILTLKKANFRISSFTNLLTGP